MTRAVRRLAGGGLQVRLSAREHELLRSLPRQMRPVIAGEQYVAGVPERLFPPAYDDAEREREYRDLVGDSLFSERLAKLDAFAATLDEGRLRLGVWTVELDADAADAWLSAVNDARLTLGVVAGITTESEWEHGPDDRDPTSVALWYLGWLQEQVLAALTGGLDEERPDPR